jgi:hypothetical protein
VSILSSASWFLACAYLFVAAFTLFRARFRPADDIPPGQVILTVDSRMSASARPLFPERAIAGGRRRRYCRPAM